MEAPSPLEQDPGRRTPAKGVRISSIGPTIVLLTINADKRAPWMAQPIVQRSLEEIWRAADAWLAGYYVIMPDHLHLFCAPRDLRFTIEHWYAYWKSRFSRAHNTETWRWQRGGFHHRIRNEEEYREKWDYVKENPLRKGLVNRTEEWPFQGVIHDLRW